MFGTFLLAVKSHMNHRTKISTCLDGKYIV